MSSDCCSAARGCSCPVAESPPHVALRPFPRQTLIGNTTALTMYYSDIYDSTHWKTVSWWVQVYARLAGGSGTVLTMNLETCDNLAGPWIEMIPGGGVDAQNLDVLTGSVSDPGRYLRVRADVQSGETIVFAVHLLARPR